MDIQRSLQLLGGGLFALAVITGFCCPPGLVPSIVSVGLACATAVVFLGVLVLTLAKNHRIGGLVKAVIYTSLILMLVGSAGTYFLNNDALVEMSHGDVAVLNEDGYTLAFNGSDGTELSSASFEVVLTRPDMVSFHETISQNEPLKIDGLRIHPMEVYEDGAVFLFEEDIFTKVMGLGGIFFLIGLGLLALPTARKKGVQ